MVREGRLVGFDRSQGKGIVQLTRLGLEHLRLLRGTLPQGPKDLWVIFEWQIKRNLNVIAVLNKILSIKPKIGSFKILLNIAKF